MKKYYDKELPDGVYVYYGGRQSGKTYREFKKLEEENKKLKEEHKELVETNYDLAIKKTKLEEENERLNTIIEKMKKFLKNGTELTCGCGINIEYIYAYENALDTLEDLIKGEENESN